MKSTFFISVILIVIVSFPNINSAQEKIDFAYVGEKGPAFWHLLPNSELCQTGKKQTPIDITTEDLKILAKPPPPATFKDAKDVESTNNGHTVEISSGVEEVPLPAEITVDGEKYSLQQFHFHTPSEHRINGRHFDIEQHLVFKSETGKLSVVAIFYNVGKKESKFMAPIVEKLPKNAGDKEKIKVIGLSKLLGDIDNISQAYTYSGSLTTPPCTEGVTWYVNKNPQQVSLDQFLGLRDVMGFNSRFTQLRDVGSENTNTTADTTTDTTNTKVKRSLYKF